MIYSFRLSAVVVPRDRAHDWGEPTTEQGLDDGWIPFLVLSRWKLACNPRHIHAEDVCQNALGWTQSAELDVIEGWPTPEEALSIAGMNRGGRATLATTEL
jgi:hypothetical protein